MVDDLTRASAGRRSRPRVAVVYPIEFGSRGIVGGGERYAEELARSLARRVPTRLVTFGEKSEHRLDGDLERFVQRAPRKIHGNPLNPLSFGFLRRLRGVDVIHCTSWNTLVTDLSILFARATGKRVFVTDVGGGGSFTLSRRFRLLKRLDAVLLIANAGAGGFEAARERWRIIGAGIHVERYRPRPLAERSGVVFVGRLLPHKGIDDLVNAVRPEWPLTVIGRPYHTEYFDLLRRLAEGKQVRFITDATDDDVIEHLRSARVGVLPSVYHSVYGDFSPLPELLGFAAMEAMASGTATIVTRVGGLPELVTDGKDGFVVPPNDPDSLSVRLGELLADDALATRIGEAGRRRIEAEFTWDAVAGRCLSAYTEGKAAWASAGDAV